MTFSYNRITVLNNKPNWIDVIEGRKKGSYRGYGNL